MDTMPRKESEAINYPLENKRLDLFAQFAISLLNPNAKPSTAHHDGVIKWKPFARYWPFMRGIHWSQVNSHHKGWWRQALVFSLISDWTNGSVNTREAGDLRRYRAHYDVIVMKGGTPAPNRKGCIVESRPSDEDDDHHNDHDHDCDDDDDWCWGWWWWSFPIRLHFITSTFSHLNRRWPGPLPVYEYFVEVIPCSLYDPKTYFDTINCSI